MKSTAHGETPGAAADKSVQEFAKQVEGLFGLDERIAHTPGPWQELDGAIVCAELNDYGNFIVCEMPRRDQYGQDEANARLIAAAPELLEALRDLLHSCRHWSNQNTVELQNARAAIAKAEGK